MAWRTSSQAANYYYDKDPMTTANGLGSNITFVGEGAMTLGLQGQMQNRQDLINLLSGMSPDGSTQLRKLHFNENGDGVRAAFDKPIDVPKSLSLLATMRPDIAEKIQGVIEDVSEYAANNHCFARVTEDGDTRMVKGKGIVAVAHHSMARSVAGVDKDADPHMHGHMLIMGVMCPDGKVRALETDSSHLGSLLHRDNLKEQQQMAYNGFASVLQEAGIAVEYRVNAGGLVIPEVAGLWELNEMFSSRHNAINSVDMDALRERYPNMSQSELEMVAELRTKTAKDTNITHRDVVEHIRELVPDNLRNEELSIKQWTITETTFAVGERVQYIENNNTKEGRAHGITNSSRHEILGWTDDNKAILFNGRHQYVTDLQDTMVANGTMSTIHGSQGKSPDGIVGYLPSGNMLNVNAEYVNDTRHKYLLSCATDNVEAFVTGINRQDTKTSASELVEAMQQLEAVNSSDGDNNISRILNSLSDDTKDSAPRHQDSDSRDNIVESNAEQRGMTLA